MRGIKIGGNLMADKTEITAFLNARDKQERPQSIKELMEEFGFTESTATTYYSKWKKEYMSGNTGQTIPRDTINPVKMDEDRKELLKEIKALKEENEELRKLKAISEESLAANIEENQTLLFENRRFKELIEHMKTEQLENLTESEKIGLMAEIDKLKTDAWKMERVICKMTIEKYS